MYNNIFKYMAFALICTIIIELLVSLLLKIRDKKDLLNILLVNILTNPLVTSISLTINFFYGTKARLMSIVLLELFAFLTEALIYKKVLNYKKINPFFLSLILNISSYGSGLLIYWLF